MSLFSVSDQCVKCGRCAELCPARVISFEKGREPWTTPESEANCFQCGQCVCFCPVSACYLSFQPEAERIRVDPALWPAAESAETFLRSRRSIRRYKKESVPDELVGRILQTVRYAPSAVNAQPVRWVLTRDRERTVALGDLTAAAFQRMAAAAPEDDLARHLGKVAKVYQKGVDLIFRGAPQLAVSLVRRDHEFSEDGAMALTYFELAAHAHGVGCCWAGFFTTAARLDAEVQKALGLREGEMVVGAQMFGFPDGLGLSRLLPPRKQPDLTWI